MAELLGSRNHSFLLPPIPVAPFPASPPSPPPRAPSPSPPQAYHRSHLSLISPTQPHPSLPYLLPPSSPPSPPTVAPDPHGGLHLDTSRNVSKGQLLVSVPPCLQLGRAWPAGSREVGVGGEEAEAAAEARAFSIQAHEFPASFCLEGAARYGDRPAGLPPLLPVWQPVTPSDLAWAMGCASSRAFSFPAKEQGEEKGESVLLPVIDFVNHSAYPTARLSILPHETFELPALLPLPPGEPITIDFGQHTNDQFLLGYSFIARMNDLDSVPVPSTPLLLGTAAAAAAVVGLGNEEEEAEEDAGKERVQDKWGRLLEGGGESATKGGAWKAWAVRAWSGPRGVYWRPLVHGASAAGRPASALRPSVCGREAGSAAAAAGVGARGSTG
ncbi:hypothetical protein CLOP_g8771 [Closterium sp. NIES-67]|nr:hypothetical protein CLOP_g8771 [Closterium sp. NIES-67]